MNVIIKKIKFGLASLFAMFKMWMFSVLYKHSKDAVSIDGCYIISLTTYNKRIKTVYLAIESLLNQSIKPVAVYLWLAKADLVDGKIPLKLQYLQRRGLKIVFVEENYRSYKKLSYIFDVLDDYPSATHIITADDDIIYPHYWAQYLLERSIFDNVVSCYRGHDIIYDNGSFLYCESMSKNTSKSVSSYQLLPTGCSGICYPIASLTKEISNYGCSQKFAADADDIWFKGITLSGGYKCGRVTEENVHFPVIITCLADTLYQKNVFQNENEMKLKNTFAELNVTHYFQG